jgi:hypothetical protein
MPILFGVIAASGGGLEPFGTTTWISGVNYNGSSNINITVFGSVSSNNLYSVQGGGGAGLNPANKPAFWLQDSTGTVLLSKAMNDSSEAGADNAHVDADGNVYFCYNSNKIVKVNKLGSVVWAKQLNFTYASIYGLTADGSKLFGRVSNYEADAPYALNTSDGSVLWTKNQSNYSVNNLTSGGVGNTSFIITGYERNSSNLGFIRSVNVSTGDLNFSRVHNNTGFVGITAFGDSNDNAYAGGYSGSSSWATKVNSSGTLQWSKSFGSGQQFPQKGAVDSSGNVYWGHNDGTKHYIIKLDSSGNVQWQRTIYGSAGTSNSGNPVIVSGNNMYITFSASDGFNVSGYTAILPTDGSKTGTYTVNGKTITYAASSLSIGNSGSGIQGDVSYGGGSVSTSNYTPSLVDNTNSIAKTNI